MSLSFTHWPAGCMAGHLTTIKIWMGKKAELGQIRAITYSFIQPILSRLLLHT